MEPATHLLRLEPAPAQRDSALVRVASSRDPQWGAVLFRAPSLPTPHQCSNELPFTVNFRAHIRPQP